MKFRLEIQSLFLLALLGVGAPLPCFAQSAGKSTENKIVPLRQGWEIQSGCNIQADGAQLSSGNYHPQGWINATVPTTVLAAQVAAGIYPDPYYGMNLRTIPGGDYPIGKFFSNMEMPAGSPYRCAWWYRKQVQIPASSRGKTAWLHFGGINYRANVWVNGKLVANDRQIAGAYRVYNLDITKAVTPGKSATIAVETFAPGRATLVTAGHVLHVHLENPSRALAFQVEVQGSTADGKPILPLLWSDDFVELMPGEHRDLTAELPKETAANQASVIVSGWNTNTLTLGAKLAPNAGTGAR
ncbi:MAG: glycosyl hydrolase 2 galactose-binding domain-containing protein [Acidobacteriaceae bacterium]